MSALPPLGHSSYWTGFHDGLAEADNRIRELKGREQKLFRSWQRNERLGMAMSCVAILIAMLFGLVLGDQIHGSTRSSCPVFAASYWLAPEEKAKECGR